MEVETYSEDTSTFSKVKNFMCTKQFIIGAVIVIVIAVGFLIYYNKESFSPRDEFDKLIDRIHKRQGIIKSKK